MRIQHWLRFDIRLRPIGRLSLATLFLAMALNHGYADGQLDWLQQLPKPNHEQPETRAEARLDCLPTRTVGIAESAEHYYASCKNERAGPTMPNKGLSDGFSQSPSILLSSPPPNRPIIGLSGVGP